MKKTIAIYLVTIQIAISGWSQGIVLSEGTVLNEHDVITGLEVPWEILWGPDDYIWCTERKGKISRIDPANGNKMELINLDPSVAGGASESGMLGLALHPDFPVTPKVYVAYIAFTGYSADMQLKLISLDFTGYSLTNPQTLLEGIPANDISVGGRLIVTPDQKLLLTVGDMGLAIGESLDLTNYIGKVLRINLDGSVPSDNPDPTSHIFTIGHKNPQGLAIGPNGKIYSSEIGRYSDDEINSLEAGGNYGYPMVSGACNTDGEIFYCDANNVKIPLGYWLPNMGLNGMEYYSHPAIPEFDNCLLIGAIGNMQNQNRGLYKFKLSNDGNSLTDFETLMTTYGMIRDICVNPYTGAIYVATNGFQLPGAQPNRIIELANESFDPNSVVINPEDPDSTDVDLHEMEVPPKPHGTSHEGHPSFDPNVYGDFGGIGGGVINTGTVKPKISDDSFSESEKDRISKAHNPSQYLIIYPNPANQTVYLTFSPEFVGQHFEIFSYEGQLKIKTKIMSTQMSFNTGALQPGNYFIRVANEKGTISKALQIHR